MRVEAEKKTISRTLDRKLLKGVIKTESSRKGEAVNARTKKNGFVKVEQGNNGKSLRVNPSNGKKMRETEKGPAEKEKEDQGLDESDDDDYFNILEGLEDEEEEKKRRVEEYVNSLPQFSPEADPQIEEEERASSKQRTEELLNQSSCQSPRKAPSLNPYLSNNITFFSQKKNYTFNAYQIWKIKHDNDKIGERLQQLETRKKLGTYFNSVKRIPSNAAVIRENNSRRIEAENKVMDYQIQRIKEKPNKKAPWYNPQSQWYINNLEKNKKI